MKSIRIWILLVASGFFAIGLVWQTSRFANLSQKAQDLEMEQQNWVAQNTRLRADIAVLSSRERTAEIANSLGLKKIQPEERVRVKIVPENQGKAASPAPSGLTNGLTSGLTSGLSRAAQNGATQNAGGQHD
ncbi:MAG TPA: hypothetical protein PLT87_02065 [Spirochaetales bacterium]|nr:hypothetical protein [Spirochaetales bacterium]